MDDLVILVIIDGKAQRRVMPIALLVAATPADEALVKANMNRFQDTVTKDLVPYFQNYFLSHDIVDAVDMKARLTRHAKTVYGEKVKQVLMVNTFEQSSGRVP